MTSEATDLAVRVRGITKRFGETQALAGIDLDVPTGTVLGLLGPNGAGKTTAVRVMSTLLRPDAGTVHVAGVDVLREPAKVRARIGLIGQAAAVDEMLTGTENLTMFARLHGMSKRDARARAAELLERFELTDAASRIAKEYSGGMRRRLDIAAGIVVRPDVLFLDEPTTGLDPASRLSVWAIVRQLLADDVTVLLTTQYLEEADQLADDIVVIDKGAVIAHGTSTQLKGQVGGERVAAIADQAQDVPRLAQVMGAVADAAATVSEEDRRVTAPFAGGARRLPELVRAIDDAGIVLAGIELRPPTLDDVFLQLTGHGADGATLADAQTSEVSA
jgi:ABC-2 type transport system ATP-binding protein